MLLKFSAVVGLVAATLVLISGTFGTVATAQTPTAHVASAPGAPPSERTGDVIVRFRASTSLAAVGGALSDAKAVARASTSGSRLVLVSPQPGETVDDTVTRLAADPNVEFAEPNTTVHLTTTTPNDTLYAGYQASLAQIGVPAAWDTTTGGAGVTVAVLDTGVDAAHTDLTGRVLAGYDFINNDANATDDHWHGTFVAGIIAANGNNAKGIAGICWSCNILPVKVLDQNGSGSMFTATQGIDWAVAHGAKVINMSFGGNAPDAALQTSINNAWAAGVVLVAAAGNDNGGPILYPAAATNVVAVGALDTDGVTRASFSNIGPQLAISAPGVGITSLACNCGTLSAGVKGTYISANGTSFASPEVAGVAALMIANGTTNNATIVSTLKSTATDINAVGFDNNTGWGRVNAALAVGGDTTAPSVSISAPSNGATVAGTVNITATASDNVGVTRVWFYIDGAYLRSDGLAPFESPWDTSAVTPGSHQIRARAYDAAGNYTDAQVTVTVTTASDAVPPSLTITAPTNGQTVSGLVPISASASDSGGIARLWFYVDGVYIRSDGAAPYDATWDATSASLGSHSIRVRAYDNAGNFTDRTVSVTVGVADTTPPTVNLTVPTNGATVSGTVNITATASDDTAVDRVWFYVDGVYLRSDGAAPYNAPWNATAAGSGPHTILARAYDTAGNFTDATITVTVP